MATPGSFGTSRRHSNQDPSAGSAAQQVTPSSAVRDPERKALMGWTLTALKDFRALDIPGQECTRGDLHRVHTLLQRTNFAVSSNVYARIAPALCLASAFLYEPQASVFWYSLAFGRKRPVPHIVRDGQGKRREAPSDPWSRFSTVPVGVNEWQELEMFWQQLAGALTVRFADLEIASGQTQAMKWSKSYPPGPLLVTGREVLITLSYDLRTLARSFATPVPTESLPYWLRQHHYLAVTILHELCHAIHLVRSPATSEPFFEDQRQAELGFAWEQSVLNGQMAPTADHKTYTHDTIYGLQFNRWPEQWYDHNTAMFEKWPLDEDDDPVRATSRRHWTTRYPVAMDYIQSLVLRRTWEEIARDGAERLKMPKKYGLREGWTGWNAWQHAASSGYTSQFDSEPYGPWSEDSNERFRLVRRLSTPSDHGTRTHLDSDSDSDSDRDPMDLDDPADDANRRRRSRAKRPRSSTASQAARVAKRPRSSLVAHASTDPHPRRLSTQTTTGRGSKPA
ncbi:MAG: hypothetical protein LQ347_005481 [Umbilicaria vellea]|nr:MAG: hypothetical protein LQ347_005481 [Umbilicaria vellea]